MLIEYCSLIIYLARIPEKWSGALLAIGTAIIVILQEKDSYSYQYALIPLLFNQLILICATLLLKNKGGFNKTMVSYGAFWYGISCAGLLFTFSERWNYYFIFDDIFMISTAFCLFYSWQSYDDYSVKKNAIGLLEVPEQLKLYIHRLRNKIREMREEKFAL